MISPPLSANARMISGSSCVEVVQRLPIGVRVTGTTSS
jgi:hypothetical protein